MACRDVRSRPASEGSSCPGFVQFPGSGGPRWAVSGGVVYLTGSVIQTSGTGNAFAVLPRAARPAHALWITVCTNGGTHGYLTIFPDGEMFASSSPQTNAQFYTSLSTISFPARSPASHELALRNAWQSSQSVYHSGDPSYSASHGIVYLSGSMHGGSGSNQPFAVLPRGLRPAHYVYISVYTFQGTTGILEIGPDGRMYAYAGGTPSYTSLAGVSFPAASVSTHKITLLNG